MHIALKLKRSVVKRASRLKLEPLLPDWLQQNRFPGLLGPIHSRDEMLTSATDKGLQHYILVGASALHNIEASLESAGTSFKHIKSCLDLPCGHGRVLRWLSKRIDPEFITACEVDEGALAFCTRVFGVRGITSNVDVGKLTLPSEIDLIWVGSLLTHLDRNDCLSLLRRLVQSLSSHGVLVFTTHGNECLRRLRAGSYGKEFIKEFQEMERAFQYSDFVYRPYEGKTSYGIAFHGRQAVLELMAAVGREVRLVRYSPQGWADHQDVWSYQVG